MATRAGVVLEGTSKWLIKIGILSRSGIEPGGSEMERGQKVDESIKSSTEKKVKHFYRRPGVGVKVFFLVGILMIGQGSYAGSNFEICEGLFTKGKSSSSARSKNKIKSGRSSGTAEDTNFRDFENAEDADSSHRHRASEGDGESSQGDLEAYLQRVGDSQSEIPDSLFSRMYKAQMVWEKKRGGQITKPELHDWIIKTQSLDAELRSKEEELQELKAKNLPKNDFRLVDAQKEISSLRRKIGREKEGIYVSQFKFIVRQLASIWKITPQHTHYSDFLQAGGLAVFKSISDFDLRKSSSFHQLLKLHLSNQMRIAIGENQPVMPYVGSPGRSQSIFQVRKGLGTFVKSFGKLPTNEQLHDHITQQLGYDVTLNEVATVRRLVDANNSEVVSLDDVGFGVSKESGVDRQSLLETYGHGAMSQNPEHLIAGLEVAREFEEKINHLDSRLGYYAQRKFGLDSAELETEASIAKRYNVSKANVTDQWKLELKRFLGQIFDRSLFGSPSSISEITWKLLSESEYQFTGERENIKAIIKKARESEKRQAQKEQENGRPTVPTRKEHQVSIDQRPSEPRVSPTISMESVVGKALELAESENERFESSYQWLNSNLEGIQNGLTKKDENAIVAMSFLSFFAFETGRMIEAVQFGRESLKMISLATRNHSLISAFSMSTYAVGAALLKREHFAEAESYLHRASILESSRFEPTLELALARKGVFLESGDLEVGISAQASFREAYRRLIKAIKRVSKNSSGDLRRLVQSRAIIVNESRILSEQMKQLVEQHISRSQGAYRRSDGAFEMGSTVITKESMEPVIEDYLMTN